MTRTCLYHHGINHLLCNLYQNQLQNCHIGSYNIQPMFKNIDPDAHIRVFNKAIKAYGKTMETDIINLFGFTLRDNIFKWGEKYVQDHPNHIFEELKQAICK